MNIYILHGAGINEILKKIDLIKKEFDPLSILTISKKNLKSESVLNEIISPGLFAEKRLAILEDFDESFEIENLPDDENLNLVLKFTKALPAKSKFLNLQRKNMKLSFFPEEKETSIFPFLDAICNKNPKALEDLEKLYVKFGGQYILTMFIYSVRRIILPLKTNNSFAMKNIENLKKSFSKEKILKFYLSILEIDFKIKTGILDERSAIQNLSIKLINL